MVAKTIESNEELRVRVTDKMNMLDTVLCILLLVVFLSFKVALEEIKSVQQTLQKEISKRENKVGECVQVAGLPRRSASYSHVEQKVCSFNEGRGKM